MTRNPSVDYTAAHRRYVFGEEISLTDLAVEMNCSRAALAAKAAGEEGALSWFEQRKEFESRIAQKALLTLADEWAVVEAESRRKRMAASDEVLDIFVKGVKDGTIKISAKDAVEWVRLQRDEFEDLRQTQHPDLIDGQAVEMTEEQARESYAEAMKQLGIGPNGAVAADG